MLDVCIRENMYIVPKSSIICLTHIKMIRFLTHYLDILKMRRNAFDFSWMKHKTIHIFANRM